MVNFSFDARKLAQLLFQGKGSEVRRSVPISPSRESSTSSTDTQRSLDAITTEVMDSLFEALVHRITNESDKEKFKGLELLGPKRIKEPDRPPEVSHLLNSKKMPESFYRFRARNDKLCLSARSSAGKIEIFIIPTKETVFLSYAEFDTRLKAKLELVSNKNGQYWTCDNQRLKIEEILLLIDRCLNALYPDEDSATSDPDPFNRRQIARKENFERPKVDSHKLDMQNLAWRLVHQQEETKRQVSRDLHDTVIADLLMLKRYMSGDRQLTDGEVIETLDEIVEKLRDICNDYAPRNLQDWGLKVSLEGLLERVEERSGITCRLETEVDIPKLAELAQLHVFRIVQEALNNAEKYSSASEINVVIATSLDYALVITVRDNGAGYDATLLDEERSDGGGMGMASMRQRADIIRSLYPTRLTFDSRPNEGAQVKLEIHAK